MVILKKNSLIKKQKTIFKIEFINAIYLIKVSKSRVQNAFIVINNFKITPGTAIFSSAFLFFLKL